MRLLFLLVVVVNIGLLAYGQGAFGPPPSEEGRLRMEPPQLNPQVVTLGEPSVATPAAR